MATIIHDCNFLGRDYGWEITVQKITNTVFKTENLSRRWNVGEFHPRRDLPFHVSERNQPCIESFGINLHPGNTGLCGYARNDRWAINLQHRATRAGTTSETCR